MKEKKRIGKEVFQKDTIGKDMSFYSCNGFCVFFTACS